MSEKLDLGAIEKRLTQYAEMFAGKDPREFHPIQLGIALNDATDVLEKLIPWAERAASVMLPMKSHCPKCGEMAPILDLGNGNGLVDCRCGYACHVVIHTPEVSPDGVIRVEVQGVRAKPHIVMKD